MNIRLAAAGAAVLAMSAAGAALADPIPYPNPGTPNPVTYTFTAAATGDIIAYFAGSGASYTEEVGMEVNGTPTGIVGLNDHTTPLGFSLDLGSVTAGDTLIFFDVVQNIGLTWYSDPALNADAGNHVYSTAAVAGQAYSASAFGPSPAGVYVGFEDLDFRTGSDYNYFDDTFVFTDTAITTHGGVPEPTTWSLMLLGVGGIGGLMRRKARLGLAA